MNVMMCGPPNVEYRDKSLAEAAQRILRDSPYHSIRQLQCRCHDGVLTLSGDVASFHLKQLSQIAVQHLDGVERIRNVIEVDGVTST
jgi:osmotically-inducible protein OsmY